MQAEFATREGAASRPPRKEAEFAALSCALMEVEEPHTPPLALPKDGVPSPPSGEAREPIDGDAVDVDAGEEGGDTWRSCFGDCSCCDAKPPPNAPPLWM